MIFVFGGQIIFPYRAGGFAFGMNQCHCNMLYILEARIDTNRLGTLTGYLKAVVIGGVMRSCHLHPAAGTQMIDCEIHLRSINHPYINHICARGIHSFYKRASERLAVLSHIAGDAQRLGIGLAPLVTSKH